MLADAWEGLRLHEVPRAHERHRAVGEGRRQRAGKHGEDEQRMHRDRGDCGEDEHRSEHRVDGDETPRVPVEVAAGEPEGTAGAHPLTPAETAPETK